jgi:hypothetical protein
MGKQILPKMAATVAENCENSAAGIAPGDFIYSSFLVEIPRANKALGGGKGVWGKKGTDFQD